MPSPCHLVSSLSLLAKCMTLFLSLSTSLYKLLLSHNFFPFSTYKYTNLSLASLHLQISLSLSLSSWSLWCFFLMAAPAAYGRRQWQLRSEATWWGGAARRWGRSWRGRRRRRRRRRPRRRRRRRWWRRCRRRRRRRRRWCTGTTGSTSSPLVTCPGTFKKLLVRAYNLLHMSDVLCACTCNLSDELMNDISTMHAYMCVFMMFLPWLIWFFWVEEITYIWWINQCSSVIFVTIKLYVYSTIILLDLIVWLLIPFSSMHICVYLCCFLPWLIWFFWVEEITYIWWINQCSSVIFVTIKLYVYSTIILFFLSFIWLLIPFSSMSNINSLIFFITCCFGQWVYLQLHAFCHIIIELALDFYMQKNNLFIELLMIT